MRGRNVAEAAAPSGSGRVESGSIIVGVDGSRGSQIALEWAQHHAARLGPVVAATATEGSAAEGLLELASDAQLLVVGSRGRSPLAGSLLGSTSAHCAHHSTVPVAIVPDGIDPRAPVGHIAVGVDGSENSMEALRWTLRVAPAGAVIDVFFSWMSLPVASSLTAPELDRVRASSEDFLRAIVDRLIGEEQAWHRTIHRHLAVGDPAAVLLASEASVIVVGARSEGGLMSTLMRSPANSLVHATRAVTVFVPPSRTCS